MKLNASTASLLMAVPPLFESGRLRAMSFT
jgi:hypothetical protein